jgi:hypothetical protein
VTVRVMPEAHALRRVAWQLFVTLTFVRPPKTRARSLPRLFRWLRTLAGICGSYFPALLWVARFEVGPTGGHRHYHLLIAGIPQALLSDRLCRSLESAWRTCGGGLSEVTLYNPARDGVGYVLKLPAPLGASGVHSALSTGIGGDDCEPMLSKALIQGFKRGRI